MAERAGFELSVPAQNLTNLTEFCVSSSRSVGAYLPSILVPPKDG